MYLLLSCRCRHCCKPMDGLVNFFILNFCTFFVQIRMWRSNIMCLCPEFKFHTWSERHRASFNIIVHWSKEKREKYIHLHSFYLIPVACVIVSSASIDTYIYIYEEKQSLSLIVCVFVRICFNFIKICVYTAIAHAEQWSLLLRLLVTDVVILRSQWQLVRRFSFITAINFLFSVPSSSLILYLMRIQFNFLDLAILFLWSSFVSLKHWHFGPIFLVKPIPYYV